MIFFKIHLSAAHAHLALPLFPDSNSSAVAALRHSERPNRSCIFGRIHHLPGIATRPNANNPAQEDAGVFTAFRNTRLPNTGCERSAVASDDCRATGRSKWPGLRNLDKGICQFIPPTTCSSNARKRCRTCATASPNPRTVEAAMLGWRRPTRNWGRRCPPLTPCLSNSWRLPHQLPVGKA